MSLFQVTKKQVIENYELRTMTGDIVSFTPSYSQLLPDPFSDLNVKVNVEATGGNGTPDNPNPINGYSEANIVNTQNESIVDLFSIDSDFKGSVAFNQMVQNGNFIDTTGWGSANATQTASGNVLSITKTGPLGYGCYRQFLNMPLNHKVLRTIDIKGASGVTYYFNTHLPTVVANGSWQTIATIKTFANSTIYFNVTSSENGDYQTVQIANLMFIDLTQMFGSTIADYIYGLEQATPGAGVAFFRSIYPADYYDYNVGTNELVGKIIPNATIAFGQAVYGGVLDVTRGKLHVTWGVVDLGDLNWVYRGPHFPNVFATNSISDYKLVNDVNALCSIYAFGGTVVGIANISEDKTAYFYYASGASDHFLYIKDTAYTDKNTFITAVTGQKIAYELATPFDIDLTPEVISAVVGENNVYSDTGSTTVTCLI